MRVPRTFVFVDISGFTNFTNENGDDAAGRLLASWRAVTRDVASETGVRIAKWLGDGCMIVAVDQRDAIIRERLWLMGSGQGHLASGHVRAAMHHLAVCEHVHQRFQCSHIGVEFEHKLQSTATGQAKTVRFIGTHTVGHTFG